MAVLERRPLIGPQPSIDDSSWRVTRTVPSVDNTNAIVTEPAFVAISGGHPRTDTAADRGASVMVPAGDSTDTFDERRLVLAKNI